MGKNQKSFTPKAVSTPPPRKEEGRTSQIRKRRSSPPPRPTFDEKHPPSVENEELGGWLLGLKRQRDKRKNPGKKDERIIASDQTREKEQRSMERFELLTQLLEVEYALAEFYDEPMKEELLEKIALFKYLHKKMRELYSATCEAGTHDMFSFFHDARQKVERFMNHSIWSRNLKVVLFAYDKSIEPSLSTAIELCNEERGPKYNAISLEQIPGILSGSKSYEEEMKVFLQIFSLPISAKTRDELTQSLERYLEKSARILDLLIKIADEELSNEKRDEWIEKGCYLIYLSEVAKKAQEEALTMETEGAARIAQQAIEIIAENIDERLPTRPNRDLCADMTELQKRLFNSLEYLLIEAGQTKDDIIAKYEFSFLDTYGQMILKSHTPIPEKIDAED